MPKYYRSLNSFEKAGEPISATIPAPAEYIGLERFAARKKLVAEATENGWLDKIEPYTLKAPKGDRSGVIVEPFLTDQWYVTIAPLAQPAIEAVQNGRLNSCLSNTATCIWRG